MSRLPVILQSLQQLEAEKNVRILYACESGSRGWGFPSPDSDYDVRFIFIRPLKDYLSLKEPADSIECPITDDLDINGWDIRKAFLLLTKSNGPLLEWLFSPIQYREETLFIAPFRQLARDYFSPQPAAQHYLGLARKQFHILSEQPTVKLKTCFYILRPLLAARWITTTQTIPPVEFKHLLPLLTEQPDVLALIADLEEQKQRENESYRLVPPARFTDFVTTELAALMEQATVLPRTEAPREQLDQLFWSLLGLTDHFSCS